MATVFKMTDRPFWFYQIAGADGKRLPRVSTKTTSKRAAQKMAEDTPKQKNGNGQRTVTSRGAPLPVWSKMPPASRTRAN